MCPPGMTTIGQRSPGLTSCVNLPGFAYMIDAMGLPTVAPCPVNTYNQGMRRQRTCWLCPAGYTTNGLTGRTDISACVVPAGSYMRFPTVVGLCPEGQWKSWVGPDDYCTSCESGVTTPGQGSTSAANCTKLLPGFYAAAVSNGVITSTRPCPQKWWCPGGQPQGVFDPANPAARAGDPTIRPCPNGQWTVEPGAVSDVRCMTPPGYSTSGSATVKCPAGSYRTGWAIGTSAASCTACGTNVLAVEDTQIQEYNTTFPYVATNVGVTTSAASCYTKKGQGMYYLVASNSFRARNCVDNNWGVNSTTFGQNISNCNSCPLNMVTSTNRTGYPNSASYYVDNGDGRTGGFTSKFACVNRPGYGFNGRWSFPCDKGSFNNEDNWSDCTVCGSGLTTIAAGQGVTSADCGIAPGYGFHSSAIVLCPQGYYNDRAIDYSKSQPCLQCPTGTTTNGTGSASPSDCNQCKPGYGGTNCAAQCGGPSSSGTYGQGQRALSTPCANCATTNFTVNVAGSNQTYVAAAASRLGADSISDCLSSWAAYGDSWQLTAGPAGAYTLYNNVANLSSCLMLCTGDCQFATYLPAASQCQIRVKQDSLYTGAPMIAFKALTAGQPDQASGAYTYYQDLNALDVGTQVLAPNANTFSNYTTYIECRAACDQDASCVGWTIEMKMLESDRPKSCRLVTGVYDPVQDARSFTRADVTRLTVPVLI